MDIQNKEEMIMSKKRKKSVPTVQPKQEKKLVIDMMKVERAKVPSEVLAMAATAQYFSARAAAGIIVSIPGKQMHATMAARKCQISIRR